MVQFRRNFSVTMLSSTARIRGKKKYSGPADKIHCSPHILFLGSCVIRTMVCRVLHRGILSKLKLPAVPLIQRDGERACFCGSILFSFCPGARVQEGGGLHGDSPLEPFWGTQSAS